MLKKISDPGLMDLITEFKNYAAMAPDEAARNGPFDKYWLILAALRELQLYRSKRPLSKAEVAREFLREIIPRAQKTQKYFQEIGFDKVKHDYVALNDIDYALSFAVAFKEVLKEWEDAESK